MPILPIFTIPLRIAVCAILLTLIAPFALLYLMFAPKQAWSDVRYLALDSRDFVAEGVRDRVLSDEDGE